MVQSRGPLPPNFPTDHPKCGANWQPYKPHTDPPTEPNVYVQRPTHKKSINKKRFFIFVAGPPGSGKSTISLSMQRNATAINPEAAGFLSREPYSFIKTISADTFKRHGWITLGHDQEICEDPSYNLFCNALHKNQPELSTGETPPPSIEDFLTPTSQWVQKMNEDQHTYNQFRHGTRGAVGEKIIDTRPPMEKRAAATKWFNENLSGVVKKNISKETHDTKFDRFSISKSMLTAINYWNNGVDSPRNLTRAWADGEGYLGTDIMFYTKLLYMIQNGVNIVYETTFQKPETLHYIFQQISTLTNNCEDYQYIIMLGFPIVNILTLQNRILNRFIKTRGQRCSAKSTSICEYRGLQGINFQSLACQMRISYNNLIAYIEECGGLPQAKDVPAKECPGIGIDLLYIYNNNKDNAPEELWDAIRLSQRSYSIRGYTDKAAGTIPKNKTLDMIIEQLKTSLQCIPLAYRGLASLLCPEKTRQIKVYDANSWVKEQAHQRFEQEMKKCSLLVSLSDPKESMKDYNEDLLEGSQTSAEEEDYTSMGGGSYPRKVISRRRITRRYKRKGKKGRRRTRRRQSS